MRRFTDLATFAACAGQEIGATEWLTLDQARVDDFARSAGDDLWIHVDPERARTELPGGRTIVHGFLLLSLVTHLASRIWSVDTLHSGVLYGVEAVRFPASVATGSRIRLRQSIDSAVFTAKGLRVAFANRIEAEGLERPAMVARTISVLIE